MNNDDKEKEGQERTERHNEGQKAGSQDDSIASAAWGATPIGGLLDRIFLGEDFCNGRDNGERNKPKD